MYLHFQSTGGPSDKITPGTEMMMNLREKRCVSYGLNNSWKKIDRRTQSYKSENRKQATGLTRAARLRVCGFQAPERPRIRRTIITGGPTHITVFCLPGTAVLKTPSHSRIRAIRNQGRVGLPNSYFGCEKEHLKLKTMSHSKL